MKWSAGLDTGRLVQPGTYFELGKDWQHVTDERISDSTLCGWDHICFARLTLAKSLSLDGVDINVPMDVIAKTVEERFPGRWAGEFKVGSRGLRFWDLAADHPNGIMVCEGGCRVFTPHDKPFMSWADIFGRKFVEQFIGDRTKQVRDRVYWDGRSYWFESNPGNWEQESSEQFQQTLRVLGFSNKAPKGRTYSDVDEIMRRIRQENTVAGACPMIYMPVGVSNSPDSGARMLNTRLIVPIRPAAPSSPMNSPWAVGGKAFPFIHEILSNLFVDAADVTNKVEWLNHHEPCIQLATFLHWLKRSYEGGLSLNPSVGQALILVGGVDKGKTLVNRHVIGKLLGGSADGSEALIEGNRFNADVTSSPVLRIDDPETRDRKTRKAFEMRMKKLVANGVSRSERKFSMAFDVPWCVRICMTCNNDAESTKMLPGLTSSNQDKVLLLCCGDRRMKFHPDMSTNEALIAKELPHFGRWLMDWTPPESTKGGSRYGVKAYHHASVLDTIEDQGLVGLFLDVFDRTFHDAPKNQEGKREFKGTALDLYEVLLASCPNAMRPINARALGTVLTVMKNGGRNITKDDRRDSSRRVIWTIPYDLRALNTRESMESKERDFEDGKLDSPVVDHELSAGDVTQPPVQVLREFSESEVTR
jgi:hypothetical protein